MGEQTTACERCDGDGWYDGHDDACHEGDGCVCSGVQIQCEACGGTGEPAAAEERDQ